MKRLNTVIFLLLASALTLHAGLRDIVPRPQQMGTLAGGPVLFLGTPHLVIPDNPTAQELVVRDFAIQMLAEYANISPEINTWSEYADQSPSIWLGTLSRFPALAAALDSSDISGLGTTIHGEEYQLLVQDDRVLLGGSDLRGLRWGLMSFARLIADFMGRTNIDRVYIRDWPDFSKRVATINSPIRIDYQTDYCHLITDLAFDAKMNEIEWNDADAGFSGRSAYSIQQSGILANKIRNNGMSLTMSVDQTAYSVTEKYWQEGIPIEGTPMLVGSTQFSVIPGGYGIPIPNGTFESWTGSRPNSWSMYRETYYSYIQRDNVYHHSGSSSIKFNNLSGAPSDVDIRQIIHPGTGKAYKVIFWYKTSGYQGMIRILDQGQTPPYNRTNHTWISFSSPTTRDWTRAETQFFTFNLDSVMLLVGPNEPVTGSVWLDDISIEAIEPRDVVRRNDTPLQVTSRRTGQTMTESVDYRVVETSGTNYSRFVSRPRFEPISGGRLSTGDTMDVNWSWAMLYNGNRQTVCFSMIEPLLEYQHRIAVVDSMLHPSGFKIHINEVSYADFDLNCARRNMTPAQLVGSYCRQMYQIIQARRPGAPVRIYGDAFDEYVRDSRAMPVSGLTWTIGSLQELPQPVEIMAMAEYTSNLDSSFDYFDRNNHASVLATNLPYHFDQTMARMRIAAQSPSCVGTEFYLWGGTESDLSWKIAQYGQLAWNMGPYVIHAPPTFTYHPDSMLFTCEAWSDTFNGSYSPQISNCVVNYRLLPGGNWNVLPLASAGTDQYSAMLHEIGPDITAVEYYFSVSDNRNLTSTAPADAPNRTFLVPLPHESGPSGGLGGEEIPFHLRMMTGFPLIEWQPQANAISYEVHVGEIPEFGYNSRTLVARQSPDCPRFLFTSDTLQESDLSLIHVIVRRQPTISKWNGSVTKR